MSLTLGNELADRQSAHGDESLQILARLSSFTAHELVNPLSALSMSLYLLSTRNQDAAVSPLVDRCRRLAQHMEELVSDLRLLGGAHSLALEQVDVGDMVAKLFDSLHLPARFRTVLQVAGPGCPLVVRGHTRLFSIVLENLVRNAIEAMPKGGVVGVYTEVRGASVRITVWDNGQGIPADRSSRLFEEPFTTKERGSGLGLLLAKAIVEHVHHGRLSFAPNEPCGAQFHIDLPILTQSCAFPG